MSRTQMINDAKKTNRPALAEFLEREDARDEATSRIVRAAYSSEGATFAQVFGLTPRTIAKHGKGRSAEGVLFGLMDRLEGTVTIGHQRMARIIHAHARVQARKTRGANKEFWTVLTLEAKRNMR